MQDRRRLVQERRLGRTGVDGNHARHGRPTARRPMSRRACMPGECDPIHGRVGPGDRARDILAERLNAEHAATRGDEHAVAARRPGMEHRHAGSRPASSTPVIVTPVSYGPG